MKIFFCFIYLIFSFSFSTNAQDLSSMIEEQTNGKCKTLSCYNEYIINKSTEGKCKTLTCYQEEMIKEASGGKCKTAACYSKILAEEQKQMIIDRTNGRCSDIVCYCSIFPCSSRGYDYEVSGYGDSGYATGEITADSDGNVEGYLNLENGSEVSFDGEFSGYGEIEGYDENGDYYSLEVDWKK